MPNPIQSSAKSFPGIPATYNGNPLRWCWQSIDREGVTALGVVARYNRPDGGKDVVPYFKPDGKGGWKHGGASTPRPLYGLHTLGHGGDVFVCEGERCAAALHSLGLAAVTSPGGSPAPHYADWTPLDGVERAIILPDNDAPGAKYADSVAGILAALSKPPELVRVDLPGLPDKGDCVDWLPVIGWDGFEELPREVLDGLPCRFEAAVAENSKPFPMRHGDNGDSKPIPLLEPQDDAAPYPVDALGDVLGGAALAIHRTVQAPLAMCCNSVLAAAALAAQAHADVHVLGLNRRPISEFFLTIGESGERKSAVDGLAWSPVRAYEKELRKEHAKALEAFNTENVVYRAALGDAKKAHKGDPEELREALKKLPPPVSPSPPLRTLSDMTIEGLHLYLESSWPAVGIFSDEGGTITGGHGMLPEHMLHTLTGFSELWDGKPRAQVRKLDGVSILAGRRVSIHWMMQPVVATALIDDALTDGQGFLSRCLTVWPDSTAGMRPYQALDPKADPAMIRYTARMQELLTLPLELQADTRELDPPPMSVDNNEAHDAWIAFHDRVEMGLRPDGEFRIVKGLAGKTAEHAARLAGILAVFEGGAGLDGDRMRRGCALAEFYLREAMRIKGIGRDLSERSKAARMLRWLKSRPDTRFSTRDIMRDGPREFRQGDTAREALTMLAEYGHIVRDGARDKWRLVAAA